MNDKNAVALLKTDTIAKFEQRVEELNHYILTSGEISKWIVVCGNEHPMPVNFDAPNPKWPWVKVENASKWDSQRVARIKAQSVVNGNNQVGWAVLVADHVEWDIANLQKLIADLKAEK
jgi:hypothetical protein